MALMFSQPGRKTTQPTFLNAYDLDVGDTVKGYIMNAPEHSGIFMRIFNALVLLSNPEHTWPCNYQGESPNIEDPIFINIFCTIEEV